MVDLTGVNLADKNANVQYSYPIAKISKVSDSNTFYLNFYGFTQNFSASFKIGEQDTYISGICTKAIITGKSHKIGSDNHDAELVLEHKKSDNMPFYVVFPFLRWVNRLVKKQSSYWNHWLLRHTFLIWTRS